MQASLPSSPEWMRRTISTKGGAADLEAYIHADLALRTLCDLKSFACLRDVDADRLLAIGVLAASDRGFKMLDVEEGRGGYLDGVDVF